MHIRNVARALLCVFLAAVCVSAQGGPQADKSTIGGTVVNSANGKPEAGVWVIAETKLGVPYRKIVVTDDQGRFLVPELPAASYDVWVRGYGLKDSAKTRAERGAQVKLQVANAATPQEAAKIYPAAYWVMAPNPAKAVVTPVNPGCCRARQDGWAASSTARPFHSASGASSMVPPGSRSQLSEAWTVFRLPYPLPFYTRGLDGRIDNPNTGWKGRGIWTSYNSYLPTFTETKLGYVNHIQVRPNPLAN